MIEVIFQLGSEMIGVLIRDKDVLFQTVQTGAMIVPIESLGFSKQGVVKEFPDLENDPDWRDKAIIRFKAHLFTLPNEQARADYVIKDLAKYGYKPLMIKKKGFRPKRV